MDSISQSFSGAVPLPPTAPSGARGQTQRLISHPLEMRLSGDLNFEVSLERAGDSVVTYQILQTEAKYYLNITLYLPGEKSSSLLHFFSSFNLVFLEALTPYSGKTLYWSHTLYILILFSLAMGSFSAEKSVLAAAASSKKKNHVCV